MSTSSAGSDFATRVLRDMSSAVLVLDHKGQVVYVNEPASKMLEISLEKDEHLILLKRLRTQSYNDGFGDYIFNAIFDKQNTHNSTINYMAPSGRKYVFYMSSSYLVDSNDEPLVVITLDDETEKEALKQKLRDSSKTFVLFLSFFCSWILIYALWMQLKQPVAGQWMTIGVEVMAILMLVYMLKFTSLTRRDLGIGISKKELIKTLKVAGIVAVCAVIFLFLLKFVARLIAPNSFGPEFPFFDITKFGINQVLYIFTAGIQEFLARSVMQGNLERIIESKHSGVTAIIVSALIFAALHVHFGFLFMVGAAILAGLEGILYYKQKNIYGVWVVHWTFGVCGTLLSLIDH